MSDTAAVPMADRDDPLTVAIFHAFESYDDEAVEAQDGDYTRGLARLAAWAIKEQFRVVCTGRTYHPMFKGTDDDHAD